MRRLVTIGFLLGLFACVAVGASVLYFFNFAPDRLKYPIRGIDVSHHQGKINWPGVAVAGVSFAYIKASEGGDYVDASFAPNWTGARSAGIAVGAYHFFTLCRPGAAQAANFLSVLPIDQPMLPPVIDLEFEGNCSTRPSPEALKAELDAFVATVEARLGRQVILYKSDEFKRIYGAVLPARPSWVRSIAWQPSTRDWLFWQYHFEGRVAGIVGAVDLNVLNGNETTLQTLAGPQVPQNQARAIIKTRAL
jgi:lysozyme